MNDLGWVPSRAQAQRLILAELVTVNGQPVRASYKVQGDDEIACHIPAPEPLDILPQNLHLNIVFEDEHIAVVDKPAGMVVHPAPGNWDATLVHGLLYQLSGLSGIGGRERPGIVHRLDKDTSGLLVVAKTDTSHAALSACFKSHDLDRRYHALVAGVPNPTAATIEIPIGRDRKVRTRMSPRTDLPKRAVTHYRVREALLQAAWVELKLETGRTHQIRVHMEERGWPVLGDPVYGGRRLAHPKKIDLPRQMLHAHRLALAHPITGEALAFESALPADFEAALKQLRGRVG